MNWHRMWTVAKTDLKQLIGAKDFWIPMSVLGGLFFLVIPTILLLTITALGDVEAVQNVSETLEVLPEAARNGSRATPRRPGRPTRWRSTCSPRSPSSCRSPSRPPSARPRSSASVSAARASSWPTPPPRTREIYVGKLIASLTPGYVTTIVGFGAYSLMVNLIVGPEVGGWFFPTTEWWMLMLWVVPPFLALTLSLVLRLSARVKSTAAAQQASGLVSLPLILVAYGQSSGALFGGSTLAARDRRHRLGHRRDLADPRRPLGPPRPPPRRRQRGVGRGLRSPPCEAVPLAGFVSPGCATPAASPGGSAPPSYL